MKNDFELLSMYLDGELTSVQKQEIGNRIKSEPALRQLYKKLRAQNDELVKEVSQIDSIALPQSLKTLLKQDDSTQEILPQEIPDASYAFKNFIQRWQGLNWAATCSLLLIVLVSVIFYRQLDGDGITDEVFAKGQHVTKEAMIAFFNHEYTGATRKFNSGMISQRMAFINGSNNLCKYYTVDSAVVLYHVVSCYRNTRWQHEFIQKSDITHNDHMSERSELYIPAQEMIDKPVEEYLKLNIQGTPLTYEEEALYLEKVNR